MMAGKSTTILLVEDNPGDARLVREMLAEAGGGSFAVDWVSSLSEALEHLARGGIGLVLLDLGLPDSQGLDTFLRAYEHASHLPFLVLTGYADETLGSTAVRQGAQDYLPKTEVTGSLLYRAIRYAIERKQAEATLRESEKKLRLLADQLLTAQEDERKRISGELHDELGHALLTLKLDLRSIEKQLLPGQQALSQEVESILGYIDTVIKNVRRLYSGLTPGDLEDLGLTAALKSLIDEFSQHNQEITWSIDLDDIDGLFVIEFQTNIYRILQEILTNIGKHAAPTHVLIVIRKSDKRILVNVEDSGKGFNYKNILNGAYNQGLGLIVMEERVRIMGGSFNLNSRENQGTKINFTIPIS